jgi:transcriptional regulator with XRE-family HTH domain
MIMAIGERIHFIRNLRGMTQKYLGMAVGFPEKSADVRLAQYETGTRTPKEDLTASLAQVLEVSPEALNVPNIDSYTGLMHTLFALEDIYGLTIKELDGEICLCVDQSKGEEAVELHKMLCAWSQAAAMRNAGEISKDKYDEWRYRYPEFDTTQKWAKVPSQGLSDMLAEDLKKQADQG